MAPQAIIAMASNWSELRGSRIFELRRTNADNVGKEFAVLSSPFGAVMDRLNLFSIPRKEN